MIVDDCFIHINQTSLRRLEPELMGFNFNSHNEPMEPKYKLEYNKENKNFQDKEIIHFLDSAHQLLLAIHHYSHFMNKYYL